VAGKQDSFRAEPSMGLPALIRALGHDPVPMLEAAGLEEAIFEKPDNRVPADRLGRLIAMAALVTGRPDMGLLIADRFRPANLGLVGLVMSEGPNVRTALRNLVRLMHYNSGAAYVALAPSGPEAVLSYELRKPETEGANLILESVIAMMMRTMQALCGRNWRAEEVRLTRRKPEVTRHYHEYFGAPVLFSQMHDALVFSSAWLDHSVARPQDTKTSWLVPAEERSTHELVRHQIMTRLGLEPVNAAHVAKALGLSRRTLDRQLADQGVTLQLVLDEVRFSRARHLLGAGNARLVDIAFAVGYGDASGFSRAFHRWAGISPMKFRRQLLPGPQGG
jgi:AraC-like DNA-binding protein